MATITTLASPAGNGKHSARSGATTVPYTIEATIDLAAAVTAKGSALAQGDIIQAISVPAESVILAVGVEVESAMTGTSTDATIDVGVTGVDADAFVDGFDLDGASAGAWASQPAAYQPIVIGGTADTIDILIATQTNTITGGILRVTALVCSMAPKTTGTVAAVGS